MLTVTDSPHPLDVIRGSAGAIPALLDLGQRSGLERCREGPLPSAKSSAGVRSTGQRGCAWEPDASSDLGDGSLPLSGLSHGAAGIGLALYELYAVTGRQDFLRDGSRGVRLRRLPVRRPAGKLARFHAHRGRWSLGARRADSRSPGATAHRASPSLGSAPPDFDPDRGERLSPLGPGRASPRPWRRSTSRSSIPGRCDALPWPGGTDRDRLDRRAASSTNLLSQPGPGRGRGPDRPPRGFGRLAFGGPLRRAEPFLDDRHRRDRLYVPPPARSRASSFLALDRMLIGRRPFPLSRREQGVDKASRVP